MQWKSVLQLVLAQKSFQLSWKKKIDEQDCLQFFCNLNSPKKSLADRAS